MNLLERFEKAVDTKISDLNEAFEERKAVRELPSWIHNLDPLWVWYRLQGNQLHVQYFEETPAIIMDKLSGKLGGLSWKKRFNDYTGQWTYNTEAIIPNTEVKMTIDVVTNETPTGCKVMEYDVTVKRYKSQCKDSD